MLLRRGRGAMISDSQHRFEMDRLLWCLCADYVAKRREDREWVRCGAFAAKGARHGPAVVRAAQIWRDGKPKPFVRLTRSIVLGLCPLGDAAAENGLEKRVAELHGVLLNRLDRAAAKGTLERGALELPSPPNKLDWIAYQDDAKRRFEVLSEEMSRVFYSWVAEKPDPEKWGDMDDLVDALMSIWDRE
jgi:hypothetical protein